MDLLRAVKILVYRGVIRICVLKADVVRVVLGAGGTSYPGWISTDYPALDVVDEKSWGRLFKPGQVDTLLSEHVFEHLTDDQMLATVANIYRYLKSGGYIRIAVPDGFHADADYIAQVKPGGYGPGADDHKVLYNYKTLSSLLENAGYKIRLLEWFDEQGKFHYESWDTVDGFIKRSTRFDQRNQINPMTYTSLIIDAIKP
ncbi:MAG: methyltransferase domain-containing protein [Sulfurimicrobium sp.]|nr:methyltransferase domain-containing protein [Sulfurimicrobium sp.]